MRSGDAQQTHSSACETEPVTTTSGTIPGRVLVVEDEPAISDIVTTALRYQGHDVTQRDHGRDGLDEALATAYDLIVLDVMLPGRDGFEICRQLRDAGQATPVLFLTARGDADDRVQGFVTGGDGRHRRECCR